MQFAGKVAIVTGGGAGIGRAVAEKFAQERAIVIIADLNKSAADEVALEINQQGGSAMAIDTNVADSAAVQLATEAVFAKYGRIDILVNNAGIRFIKPLLEQTEEEWRQTLDVNLTAPFICTKAVIPYMLRGGKGKIVNVASVAGFIGRPNRVAYCASKGGLIAFTKAAAVDMRGKNIYVNALAPALIETPFNATFSENAALGPSWGKEVILGRWGKPSEVAEAALFLASDASDFITGTVITVDGGWTSSMVRATED